MSDTAIPPYSTEQHSHPFYEPAPGYESTENPNSNTQEKTPRETVTSLLPTDGDSEGPAFDKQSGAEESQGRRTSKKEPAQPQQPITLEGVDSTTAAADKIENELITGILDEHQYQT